MARIEHEHSVKVSTQRLCYPTAKDCVSSKPTATVGDLGLKHGDMMRVFCPARSLPALHTRENSACALAAASGLARKRTLLRTRRRCAGMLVQRPAGCLLAMRGPWRLTLTGRALPTPPAPHPAGTCTSRATSSSRPQRRGRKRASTLMATSSPWRRATLAFPTLASPLCAHRSCTGLTH